MRGVCDLLRSLVCVQGIARDLECLRDPYISEGKRKGLKRKAEAWKESIQVCTDIIERIDSQLQGESCPKGNRSGAV